jgi:hypothetical protein
VPAKTSRVAKACFPHRRSYLRLYGELGALRHPPTARFISSPDDLDAHDARKDSTYSDGDTGHLTETSGDGTPPLITHAPTTTAPVDDGKTLFMRPWRRRPSCHSAMSSKLQQTGA